MKTKEFIKRVKKMGFTIEYYKNPFSNIESNCDYDLITISANNQVLVKVWTNCQYAISTISDGHSSYLYGYDVDELYKLCFEYASTPVEDREEKKRYYLRHKWIFDVDFHMYLQKTNYDDKKMSIRIFGFNDNDDIKFTEKEIEELKEKLNTDLSDFEMVEVE